MRILLKYCLSYCSSRVLFSSFLIKANKKLDKNDENSENFTKYKSVQIFRVDEGDRLVANWHTIDGIFKKNRDAQINPLKVLVVCGKPRIGKSTFCSLLYNNNNNNFNNISNELDINLKSDINEKQGEHPKVLEKILKIFETSSKQFKPQTNGIWITPIPVSVRDRHTGHILYNVFIVDVEGILGPNSNKFIHQQLFVLASMMSSHFIYYLEHPFNEYYEQILRKYSTLAQTVSTRNQKLILLITNLKNNLEFKYGSESSNKYLTTLKQEIKTNLDAIRQNFDSLECYLMPEPSEKMRRNLLNDKDSYYSIKDVGEDYWKCLSGFREKYFEECDQTKNWEKNQGINGKKFAEYLDYIFKQVVDGKLEQIADDYRLLSDNKNTKKSAEAVVYYKEQMKKFFKEFISDKLNEENLKSKHKNCFDSSLEEFCMENPFSDWSGTDDRDYKQELNTKLNRDFEDFLKNSKLYKQCLQNYTTKMINYLRNIRLTTDISDNSDIRAMHSELKDQNILFFHKNCKNNGQSYDYKFEEKFIKTVDKFYEPIEANMTILKDMIRKHRNEIKKRFNERPWYERCFNRSNTWIHADNDCMDKIYSVSEKLSKHLNEYGFDFKDLLFDETGKIFKGKYKNTEKVENVVVVTGSTLAAIGAAALTVSTARLVPIVGGTIYFGARWLYKPKKKRNETKDQN